MKKVILKKLVLHNFKGAKDVEVEFNEDKTLITGDNGTGKSTIEDGWNWLLFDKNGAGKSDFNVKTLDAENNVIHRLDHEVLGVINCGRDITLKKIYREKWQTRRGSSQQEMTGHETTYFVDDVPVSSTEYKKYIDGLLPESLFRYITSPIYFASMKWADQRKALMDLAGKVDDVDIAGDNKDFLNMLYALKEKGLTFEKLKLQIASQKKTLNDEIALIPSRIDEVTRLIPETEPDKEGIEKSIQTKEGRIVVIDEAILDKSRLNQEALNAITTRQNRIHQIRSAMTAMEHEAKEKSLQKVREFDHDLSIKVGKYETDKDYIDRQKKHVGEMIKDVESIDTKLDVLLAEWHKINEREFGTTVDNICPITKEAYVCNHSEFLTEEARKNFNEAKIRDLETNEQKGKDCKGERKKITDNISSQNLEINDLETKLNDLHLEIEILKPQRPVAEESITYPKEYQEMLSELNGLEKDLENEPESPTTPDGSGDLKAERITLLNEITELKNELSLIETIKNYRLRIEELTAQNQKLAQQLSNLERQEMIITDFNKKKIDTISEKVNRRFMYVKFKMFNTLINGGEEETCVCMVNGVPYPDLNTASKINAGIDIINAFCEYYEISAPVFIDNAESVSVLIPTKSQIIRMEKITGQKSLQILTSN